MQQFKITVTKFRKLNSGALATLRFKSLSSRGLCGIEDSHSGSDEDSILLGNSAVQIGIYNALIH